MEDKMKNIVILKNLPSNLVEEAIVILKPDSKKIKCIKDKKTSVKTINKPKDYIVKEAEMVISNYISDMETKKPIKNKSIKNLERKYKRMKYAMVILSIILVINLI